ncbi:hypothetical protein Tco_0254724, partial [Tanacetum coccineum]
MNGSCTHQFRTRAYHDDPWITHFRVCPIAYGEPVPTATIVNTPIVSTNTSVSTTIAQDAPSISHSL